MFPGLYGKNAPWEKFLEFIQALRNIRKEIHESGPMKLFVQDCCLFTSAQIVITVSATRF